MAISSNIIMFSQGTIHKVLSQYTQEGSQHDIRINELQIFLEAKSNEIATLHRCFSDATRELLQYQRKEQIMKEQLGLVLDQCRMLRQESRSMLDEVDTLRRWKRFEEEKIRQLPHVIAQIMKQNKQLLMAKFKEQIESISRRYQFQLLRIEEAQKTQIDILKAEFKDQLELSRQTIHVLEAEVERLKTLQASGIASSIEDSLCKSTPLKSKKNNINLNECRLETKIESHLQMDNTLLNISQRPLHSISRTSTLRKNSVQKSTNKQNLHQQNINLKSRPSSIKKLQHSGTFVPQVVSLPQISTNIPHKNDGRMNGYSTLVVSGKQIYRGLWKEGRFHGRGKLTTDACIYDGEFKNGIPDGLGNLYFGRNTFIGKFVNGQASGEGTLATPEGQTSGIWNRNYLVQLL